MTRAAPADVSREGVPDRRYVRTPATAPGPSGPRMLRDFGSIRRSAVEFLLSSRLEYGSVVQFPIPSPPTYLVAEPDAVRRVLVGNARNYDKATLQYRSLSLVVGQGLLVTDGEIWRRQRRMVQPPFHHEAIRAVGDHVAASLNALLERWGDISRGAVIDMDEAMMRVALEVVGASLFGTDLSGDADRLAQATLHALDEVVARSQMPVTPPRWMPSPSRRRLEAALRELDGTVGLMIDRRSAAGPSGADLLDVLIAAAGAGDEPIDRREIRDELVSFMVAGHETVASALMWALWLVAGDAEVAEQLAAEADAVLGDRDATWEDLDRLPVARAVFDETMRLYPPVWLVTRRALADDVLGGRFIPAGSLVIMSPYVVHRDPALWEDPSAFRPQRFLDGSAPPASSHAFWPFGAGPRICVGKDFAYLEGILLLAGLARRVTVARPPGASEPRGVPLVTLRPLGALPMVVRARGR